MTGVMPKGEKVRKAVKWISEEKLLDESRELHKLIVEACSRFNLSPLEEEFLQDFYAESGEDD